MNSLRIIMLRHWLRNKSDIFLTIDAIFGVIVGIALAVGGMANHKIIAELGLLYAEIALCAAILSVALIALSVLVAVLGDNFVNLLQEIGVERAFLPYQSVAIVSALGILAAIVSIFIWPIAPIWLISIGSAIAAGLTTWAVVGAIQLVNITARLANAPFQTRAAADPLPDAKESSIPDP
jgi:hypothetical protein